MIRFTPNRDPDYRQVPAPVARANADHRPNIDIHAERPGSSWGGEPMDCQTALYALLQRDCVPSRYG